MRDLHVFSRRFDALRSRLKKLCPHPVRRRHAYPVFDALKPGAPVGERVETICALCSRVLDVSQS